MPDFTTENNADLSSPQSFSNKTLIDPTLNGMAYANSEKTANYTMTSTDLRIRANAASGGFTITLPAAASIVGQVYGIKKTDTTNNIVIIDGNASETIEGLLTWELRASFDQIQIMSDGTNWRVLYYDPFDFNAYRRVGATPNRWHIAGAITATALTPVAVVTNTMYAYPFIVPRMITVGDLGINVSTLAASSNIRLGIYKDDGNGYPGALVIDAGVASGAAAAFVAVNIAAGQKLQPGLYWIVGVTSGTPTLRALPLTASFPILGTDNVAATVAPGIGWSVAQTYGALPNPFTAGGAVRTSNAHCFYVRLV